MGLFVHHILCAAFANGCDSYAVWYSDNESGPDENFLTQNGWWIDHGRWVCKNHPKEKSMKPQTQYTETYQQKALRIVHQYVVSRLEKTDPNPVFDVYVVWFSKTLQNWKALISTTLPDGMYYEVTYDGDKRQAYVDAYKKFDNVTVPDEGIQPKNKYDLSDLGRLLTESDNKPNPKYQVHIDDTTRRGIQIGDGNVQTNTFNTSIETSKNLFK